MICNKCLTVLGDHLKKSQEGVAEILAVITCLAERDQLLKRHCNFFETLQSDFQLNTARAQVSTASPR